MDRPPVIDLWAPILPTPEILAHVREHFPAPMLGYLRVFWKRPPTAESVREGVGDLALTEEEVLAAIDEAGIRTTLITGFDEASSCGETFVPNELVAPLAERHPERFVAFAGADVGRGMDAVRELERWIVDRGFRGLSLRPFMVDLPADHRRYYPFYAKCCELGIPVSIHTSANWTSVAVNDLGHPRHLDTVAADFPELRIILSHAGYPWVLEAALLAWKYEHVYLELAAHRPRYFGTPGTGWEPLLRFGQTTIRDKVLYGTGWFLLGTPPVTLVDEMLALPIRDDVRGAWLHGNAERLLGAPP